MTLEEIVSALADNADLRKGVVGHAVGTEEGKAILTNNAKAHWDDNIGAEVKSIHSAYDTKVFELLGTRKADDQKSSDYVGSLVTELKTLREKGPEDVTELKKQLEEAKKSAGNDKHWHDKYIQEEKSWAEKFKGQQDNIEKLNLTALNGTIESELNQGLNGLQFNDAIPEEARKALIDSAKLKILGSAKIEDGKVVYYKEDGTVWRDENVANASAGFILAGELKSIMKPVGTPGGGAKVGEDGKIITVGEGTEATTKLILDKSKFTTREEFTNEAHKTLTAQGIAKTDPKFRELVNKAYVEYKVSELKLN